MPNIVAIVSDDRVRKQIERFIAEMNNSEVRLASFSKLKDFEELYFKPKKAEPPPAEKPKVAAAAPTPAAPTLTPIPASGVPAPAPVPDAEKKPEQDQEPVDLRLFSQVHMIIFNPESLAGEKVGPWCAQMMRKTKERSYWPEGNRTRFVLLKFEDDGLHKLDVLLPELDDLIYFPLDRLIFLQKLEVILGLPKKVKGSYLFNQPVKADIEISKISKLERFSDVALAVRNPVAFRPGTRVKFYVQLPGEKENIRFFAKAIRSEVHPEYPDQFLCYFTFFGLRRKETTRIRQWLTRGPKFKMFVAEDKNKFKVNPSDLEQVERAGPMKNIVVIDPDPDQATTITTQIRNEMDHVHLTTEGSYNYFVHKYINGQKTQMAPPKASKADDIPNGSVRLEISLDQRLLQKSSYTPGDEELFFGHIAKDIFKIGSGDWWRPFKSVENDLILDEAVNLLVENKTSGKVIVVTSATNEHYALRLKVSPEKGGNTFTVEFQTVTAEAMADELGGGDLTTLDAMVIDAAFIPQDFNAWIEFLRTSCVAKKLINKPEDLKLVLTTDREDRLERAWLDSPNVIGFLLKPIDNRQLLFMLAEALKSPFTPYTFPNVMLATTFVNCHMSREIDIELISEFGATLRSATPFRPGTFFFLRKLIFDNAPNQCLAARVYFCEAHPEVKGQYQVSVLYYGINDAFLKFARTWIRETYASSKAQQG